MCFLGLPPLALAIDVGVRGVASAGVGAEGGERVSIGAEAGGEVEVGWMARIRASTSEEGCCCINWGAGCEVTDGVCRVVLAEKTLS